MTKSGNGVTYEGGKFFLAELGINDSLKKMSEIKTNLEGIESLDMQDFDNKQSIIDACDGILTVYKNLVELSKLVNSAKYMLSYGNLGELSNLVNYISVSPDNNFVMEYNSEAKKNIFKLNGTNYLTNFGIGMGLNYDDEQLKKYIDGYIENNPELRELVEEQEKRETFKKYLDHYENPWLYNYMFGNGSYEDAKKYVTKDKKYFISFSDGCGRDDKNFAFGILHYLDGKYYNVEHYKSVGIDIKNGNYDTNGVSKIPVEKVLEVQDLILEENEKKVKNNIGVDNYNKLTTDQQYCLVDIAYHGCSTESWNDLKSMLDNGYTDEQIANNWSRLNSTSYNNESRKNARRELWLNGNYTDANGDIIKY